jgi:hypothetical protein
VTKDEIESEILEVDPETGTGGLVGAGAVPS